MPITQQDIAEKVGVSRRLVSYALNGQVGVGAEMSRRILATAADLGYQANRAAQALVTGRTYQIALCVPTLSVPYHAEFIRHFEEFARHTPYDLLVTTTPQRADAPAQLAVDGMLLHRSAPLPDYRISHPTVVLQSPPSHVKLQGDGPFDQVLLGLSEASNATMQHLLENKSARIAFVSFAGMMMPQEPRHAAYRQAMKRAKLPPEIIALSYNGSQALRPLAHRELESYFRAHGFPDALFCCNDEVAIGAYRALRALGRRIPDETLVAGCDDIPEVEDLFPALTSIRHDWEAICRSAWQMLMTRIENPDLPARQSTIQGELVIRDSSLRAASTRGA